MNIFNRILTVIVLLFMAVLSLVAFINVFARLFKWTDVTDRVLGSTSDFNIFIGALIIFLLLAVSVALLIFEFRRKKSKTAPLSGVRSGGAMVNLAGASEQIKEELLKVEDISDVKVNVVSKSDGVVIDIFARMAKGLNVSEKMQEVIGMASKFASENLGFKIIKTNFTTTGFTQERIHKTEKLENISETTMVEKDTNDSQTFSGN
ncbi:MAG: Asp23/Gls24 family envelope stress response protein [Candidatus Humimicrobiaceae bacterium]